MGGDSGADVALSVGESDTMNSECGIGNAECKGECREANDLPGEFRIPHSAFRVGTAA